MKITKILIDNRGEIAIRIIKTCKKLGIKSVAIYSEADRYSQHTLLADEAIYIGGVSSAESYLVIDKIIDAAKKSQADAIHPGYGFLSEKAAFAKRVKEEGIIFIGPSAEAIEIMGSKLESKELAKKIGVPLVPGSTGAIKTFEEAKKIANEVGYPVLIKASAGGGGKGMRVANDENELKNNLERAKSEALNSFGDDTVFIEKYITSPRHIEIQILADNFGNVVHLFERECSIQRRHQKLVEEAPSVVVNEATREKMGNYAIALAKACNYTGVGTIEFVWENENSFYFLEMNTRLQVEHPVTEFITGLDLVEQQIKVAQNEEMSFSQNDLKITGHAIELRICAENVFQNFLPSTGQILDYVKPTMENIRFDDGLVAGDYVHRYYDPMIGKLIAYAATREKAIELIAQAIDNYIITGIYTTLPYGKYVFTHPDFIAGNFSTKFIEQNYTHFLDTFTGKSEIEGQLACGIIKQETE